MKKRFPIILIMCFLLFINVFVLFTVKHIQFACALNVLS